MPIKLPNLDDRTYDDLMQEALALIPAHAPAWTNHNPSDPGITLIEMFAFLTEMLIYRLNRVTDANKLAFLKLLNPPEWDFDGSITVNQAIQATVLSLREEQRAITPADFEHLALNACKGKLARVYCLASRNLESSLANAATQEAPSHVSLVLLPAPEATQDLPKLIEAVKDALQSRCLITTRLHVVGPRHLKIEVQITLKPKPDALEQDLRLSATTALINYFDPLTGGAQGLGWPLGRHVYVSEIYALLDGLSGVDYVEKTINKANQPIDEITFIDNQRKRFADDGKQLVCLTLEPDELIDPDVKIDIQVLRVTKNNPNR
jgi:hypothetical protein